MEKQHDSDFDLQMYMPKGFFSTSNHLLLLVKSWTTATIVGVLVATVAGAILSLSLESLKCYRLSQCLILFLFKLPMPGMSVSKRLLASLLHVTHVSLAYILVLLVTTYNVYILLAVVLGAGTGHFFLTPIFLGRINARLQRRQQALSILNCPKVSDEDLCVDCSGHDDNGTASPAGNQQQTPLLHDHPSDPMILCRQFVVKGKETSV